MGEPRAGDRPPIDRKSSTDHLWDLASMVTNPAIGYLRHPWAAATEPGQDPFPTQDPSVTIAEITAATHAILPGSIVRRRLAFRHTIEWTKPAG